MIRRHESSYPVVALCRVLGVNRSGYYAWRDRPRSSRDQANERLLVRIRAVHEVSRRNYGSPRITDELCSQGEHCNEKRVARLMRRAGIRAKTVKKYRATTNSKHSEPVYANVVNRSFATDRPNRVWLSDITYVRTSEGWLYLAAVLDLYSRRIVGCAMSSRIDSALTESALAQAVSRRRPGPGLVHHSDRGVQYAAGDYRKLIDHHGMIGSMSRKGDCWDNAPMESFFGTLKQELIFHERFATRLEAKRKIFEYIEMYYNGWRRHSSLGGVSPNEFERDYRQRNVKTANPTN